MKHTFLHLKINIENTNAMYKKKDTIFTMQYLHLFHIDKAETNYPHKLVFQSI